MAREIVGTWASPVRETGSGPMTFEFRFGEDGRFDVTGTPIVPSSAEAYRRGGPYRLEAGLLVTPALDDGRPVRLRLVGGQLLLEIDDGPAFRLDRR